MRKKKLYGIGTPVQIDMAQIPFTMKGLAQLAQLIEQAKAGMSYKEFKTIHKINLAETTIWNIVKMKVKRLELETLEAIAPALGRSVEELKAICAGTEYVDEHQRPPIMASEIWPLVEVLPPSEAAELMQLVLARFAEALPPGVAVEIVRAILARSPLSRSQMAEIMRSLADQWER